MRNLWMFICILLIGCGSSNPASSPPPATGGSDTPTAPTQLVTVPLAELLSYVSAVDVMLQPGGPIEIMNQEYAGVTADMTLNLVPRYWGRQFTRNLIARMVSLQATARTMRPENSLLRQLHIDEFEGAFEDYIDGVTYFERNLELLSVTVIDSLNRRMGAGNVHLIRLEILLSDLVGGPVNLGQGGQAGVNQIPGAVFEGGL